MGRYTSVQTFSDQDARGAAVSYDAGASAASANDGAASAAPSASAGDGPDAKSKADAPEEGSKFHVNRVDNVSGSTAGAGSGDFHMYRAARRREMERVAKMEQRYKANKVQQEFEVKRKRNAEEFEAHMQKRAEKRRRRKERARANALGKGQDEDEHKEHQATDDKDSTKISVQTDAVPETPGGVPEIPNDGSFLAKMLAMQQKETEGKSADKKPKRQKTSA